MHLRFTFLCISVSTYSKINAYGSLPHVGTPRLDSRALLTMPIFQKLTKKHDKHKALNLEP